METVHRKLGRRRGVLKGRPQNRGADLREDTFWKSGCGPERTRSLSARDPSIGELNLGMVGKRPLVSRGRAAALEGWVAARWWETVNPPTPGTKWNWSVKSVREVTGWSTRGWTGISLES